jgi:hypothetical protein
MLKLSAMTLVGCASAIASGLSLIEAENLLFSPPKEFKVGFQSNDHHMTEWIPASETVEDWGQMLTVQIYRGASVEAATFLQGVGKRYMNACPGQPPKASSRDGLTAMSSRCWY